jgi:hypothetical protein
VVVQNSTPQWLSFYDKQKFNKQLKIYHPAKIEEILEAEIKKNSLHKTE